MLGARSCGDFEAIRLCARDRPMGLGFRVYGLGLGFRVYGRGSSAPKRNERNDCHLNCHRIHIPNAFTVNSKSLNAKP